MPIHRAGTLLVPSGPENDPGRLHLQVICNDTDNDGNNLIVGLATYVNDFCDQTCIVESFEHPWLKHRSYVLYRKAQIISGSALERGIVERRIFQKADMNGQTFLRIKNGIRASIQTRRRIKNYFGCG